MKLWWLKFGLTHTGLIANLDIVLQTVSDEACKASIRPTEVSDCLLTGHVPSTTKGEIGQIDSRRDSHGQAMDSTVTHGISGVGNRPRLWGSEFVGGPKPWSTQWMARGKTKEPLQLLICHEGDGEGIISLNLSSLFLGFQLSGPPATAGELCKVRDRPSENTQRSDVVIAKRLPAVCSQ